MKHRILFLLLLAAGLLPAVADNITVDGTQRSYIVYAPNNLEANRPLFIFCHGSGQDANYMLNTQFRDTQNPERKIRPIAHFAGYNYTLSPINTSISRDQATFRSQLTIEIAQ